MLTDWQPLVALTKGSGPEVRGVVCCRTGRHDEAVGLLEPLRRSSTTFAPLLTLYLALAEHGRGRTAQAKRWLEEATAWLEKPSPNNPMQKNRDTLPWTQRVQIDQLCGELQMLLR
jgi:hypothetical protein